MFCINCGMQLSDDANFCLRCGKPQKAGVQIEEPKYEMCETKSKFLRMGFFASDYCFYAEVVGPNGAYVVGEPKKVNADPDNYRSDDKEKLQAQLNSLISSLTRDGWELLSEQGNKWYSYKLRRRIR